MTARDDFDRTLASWFESGASADGAATLLEATLDRTSRRRPRPAWVVGLRDRTAGPWVPVSGPVPKRLAYVALVVLIAVAIVIGAALVAGQRTPPPAPLRGCVGEPPTLCGFGAGEWTSAVFLPGLSLTLPTDKWYTRELADRIELKALPMTSLVEFKLDPIPRPEPWEPRPDVSGTRASIAAWMARDPGLIVTRATERRTTTGLAMSTFDIAPLDPGSCAFLFVNRDHPHVHASLLDICHYTYRWHLVEIGAGHTLSILLTALDSTTRTLDSLDAASAPIIDSIKPPASFAP